MSGVIFIRSENLGAMRSRTQQDGQLLSVAKYKKRGKGNF